MGAMSMIDLKTVSLTLLLIVMLAPVDLAAQEPKPAAAGPRATKPPTDEEIVRQAIDSLRLAQFGSEGLAAATGRLKLLLDDNRDSVTAPLLRALLDGVEEKRASQQLQAAIFYLDQRGKVRPAELRLRDIMSRYPRYSRRDEVLYQIGIIEYETGRRSDAINTLERLVTEFTSSPRAGDARTNLKSYRAGK